jgi:hypothetical protein
MIQKRLPACIPLAALAARGGGDTEDRLDVADPAVRFSQASPTLPAATLYRGTQAQPDAANTSYGFASNDFDVDLGVSDWTVKTVAANTDVGTVSIDPQRGTKYTVAALATSATISGAYRIADPYNKPLTSNSTHLRMMNAAYNVGSVGVYTNAPGINIGAARINPLIAATGFNAAGPASGSDSVDIPAGTYQLTATLAGTKTVLSRGQLSFGNNQDLLLLTVPDTASIGAIKTLVKAAGSAGTAEAPAS